MFSVLSKRFNQQFAVRGYKVAVLGSSGGCGEPISLLLKMDPRIKTLSLFDIRGAGVAVDLGHINSTAKVENHIGMDIIAQALTGADVVVIPAGCPRVPGVAPNAPLSRDSLFNINANIIKSLAINCAKYCPKAMIMIVSNPVNSLVPLFAEYMKLQGVYDPKRLFGVCTLDVVRANTFVAENQNIDVMSLNVPVIGGHGGSTILPLLSQVQGVSFSDQDLSYLMHRIKYGGDEVLKAKGADGSATLSTAYATVRFVKRMLSAMDGESNVVECAYTENKVTAAPFFSTKCLLGPNGVEEALHYGEVSPMEEAHLSIEIPYLIDQAQRGIDFAREDRDLHDDLIREWSRTE